jgi:hypothetical protein
VESFDQVRCGFDYVGNYDFGRASQAQCNISVEHAVFPGPVLDSYCYHDGFAKCGMVLLFTMPLVFPVQLILHYLGIEFQEHQR